MLSDLVDGLVVGRATVGIDPAAAHVEGAARRRGVGADKGGATPGSRILENV